MPDKTEELFENMPISKALMKLALPTVLGQIVLVVYNMADTFFIGLTESNVMITAVTICMPAFMFMSAIANLFGVGASSVISRALGKSYPDRARAACAFSFWFCALTAAFYSLFVKVCIHGFVDFLGGTNTSVFVYASKYLEYTVIYAGVFTTLNTLFSHLLRSEGHALHAGLGVVLGGVLNIVLDPLFMFRILEPGNEVVGAAVATALSNIISFLYYVAVVVVLNKKKLSIFSSKLTKESFSKRVPYCIFQAGIPACIMTFAENISYAILDRLMSFNGLIAQAGVGVAKKVNMLAHSIVRGITQGALPLLGYSYSSGNRKKTKQTVKVTLAFAVGAASFCMMMNFIFARPLTRVFLTEANNALSYGITFLKIFSIGCPFSACAYTFISFFQAVGHGKESFLLALLRKGILDIPMMFVLKDILVVYGIVMATPITDIVCCVVSIILFIVFAKKHLSKNKNRKVYNKETGTYDIIETC